MTDAIKMAEMQRANIEFERQRHLANWLIKSSAHMPKSTSLQQQILSPPSSQKKANTTSSIATNRKNTPASIKNGTITQNPMFFGQKSLLSKPSIFTSQTNLPLQIVTQSPDGHKPKLRRFNSHDTSANMFSVVDFENARLARRNEIEKQKYKMNSLSSGGDCSTGDSKGSKFSNESNTEPLPANIFLERYSLPRVIRLKYDDKFNTLLSSSSNDSGLSTDHKKPDKNGDLQGELLFLYRYLKNRNIYHGYNTKSGATKKKGFKIPQEYQGYFSLVNDRGQPTATMYTTIIQLVRERVYKFVTVENLPAYTEQQTNTFPTKSHYVKGTAKAGQIFRLLAVFQDGGLNSSNMHQPHDSSNSSLASQKDGVSFINNTSRDKERGRYAQLLGEDRQVVYVSLSVKGKFFEIEQSAPQILQRTSSLGKPAVRKKLNIECIHHISNIITTETELPILLKCITGLSGCGASIPENLTIYRISTENSLIVCPIEETDSRPPLHLRKVEIQPEMILTKCFLGFENEQRMFSNQNVQNLLKFCQYNCDNFQRLIEIEHNGQQHSDNSNENGLKILRPLNFTKFLNRDRIGHEKEDSIIFLSKHDLDNLEIHQQQKLLRKEEEIEIQTTETTYRDGQENQATISDKMKVFQSNKHKTKWYKNFNHKNSTTNSARIAASSLTNLDEIVDLEQKRRSMDRYQDMSRLIQERLGGRIEFSSINLDYIKDENSRPSSEKGVNSTVSSQSNLTKKSMSLQDVVDRNLMADKSSHSQTKSFSEAPDLVKLEQDNSISNIIDDSERDFLSMSNCQQSYISEKLFNEFHVKTKNYSKSSSNLHQLLHFAIPHKMSFNEMSKKKLNKSKSVTIQVQPTSNIPHHMPLLNINPAPQILTVEDDLPYSNVRDSLLSDQTNKNYIAENDQVENSFHLLNDRFEELQNENIYAEICNDSSVPSLSANSNDTIANRSTTSRAIGNGDSIRISVPATHHGHNIDNIYNTIK